MEIMPVLNQNYVTTDVKILFFWVNNHLIFII